MAVTVVGNRLVVKGPGGELEVKVPLAIRVVVQGSNLTVVNNRTDKKSKALHGLIRAQIANHIQGVTKGWTKTLELSGVGYRAATEGTTLVLSLGFSHPVTVVPPAGIHFSVVEGKIIISGQDKQLVGQVASTIRAIKKPEPYKGKGIKYVGEYIRKKTGKAKAIGGVVGGAK